MLNTNEIKDNSLEDDIVAAVVDKLPANNELQMLCSDMARSGQCAYRRNEDGSIKRVAPNVVYVR